METKKKPAKKDKQPISKETIRKRVFAIVLLVAIFAVVIGLSYLICRPMLEMAEHPAEFRAYMHDKKPWSIVMFMICMFLQVVAAIIPGGPFEVAAGYAFGTVLGSIIADIAMTVGSVFVFLMVRRFGMRFVELFVSKDKLDQVKFLKHSPRRDLITFILFLIPGTPKDIITYFIGFTDMKLPVWIFITFVGRFPAIFLSAVGGSALNNGNYIRLFIIGALIIVTFIVGSICYYFWHMKHVSAEHKTPEGSPEKESEENTESTDGTESAEGAGD